MAAVKITASVAVTVGYGTNIVTVDLTESVPEVDKTPEQFTTDDWGLTIQSLRGMLEQLEERADRQMKRYHATIAVRERRVRDDAEEAERLAAEQRTRELATEN